MPHLEIDLRKLEHNAKILTERFNSKKIILIFDPK